MAKWVSAIVVAGAAVVAFGAAGLLGRAPKVTGEVRSPGSGSSGTAPVNGRTIGVGGCVSAGCHGGSAVDSLSGKLDERTWNGSASHWLAVDPHTKAYSALELPLANWIMDRFAKGTRATDDPRCLACHTNPSLAWREATEREKLQRADGVSCEACHGDAGKWMPQHTTWTPSNRAAGYEQTGMARLFDIGERAAACAGCHVGAPADESRGYPVRDMNHDMIAAGHPRLNFDFADYQRRLSPHWMEEDRSPEFEVKSWLVGRAASDEAAAVLKADRATRGKAGIAPMPEYADWSCASCHHKLGDGFPSRGARPTDPLVWPIGLNRKSTALASGSDCVVALESALKDVNPAKLDADTAGHVFFGLVSRERMRMKRGGKLEYDPAFDRLKISLTRPRGNIDFHVSLETITELNGLLKR